MLTRIRDNLAGIPERNWKARCAECDFEYLWIELITADLQNMNVDPSHIFPDAIPNPLMRHFNKTRHKMYSPELA